jgi:hypothetical protein
MKKLTLDIQDNRFNTFLEFIKTLDYVSVSNDAIPQWQQNEVARRKELIEKGEMTSRSWNESKADIFKK